MSFRARLLVAFFAAAVLPLGLFAWGARSEGEARMEDEFRRRAEAMAEVIREDLRREGSSVERRLAALEERMAGDNLLRLALRGQGGRARDHLLDFAGEVMEVAGLDALHLQSYDGRVLSSGHYRNAYGRDVGSLGEAVADAPGGVALATLQRPGGPFLALVAARRVRLGGRALWLVGGLSARERLLPRLARGGGVSVTLEVPGRTPSGTGPRAGGSGPDAAAPRSGDGGSPAGARGPRSGDPATGPTAGGEARRDTVVLDRVSVPHFHTPADTTRLGRGEAAFVVAHTLAPLRRLRADTERWLLWAAAGSAALALLLSWWVAARISRPLESLAADARRLRLERGEVSFDRGRRDELGELARTLDEAARRLRASAARLKEAERRATIGEIARQVNHDIRNGLAPLRNVLSHLEEVAREAPRRLADVFREREATLDGALSYLEELAGQYERISSRPERRPCDVNAAARDVAEAADPGGDHVRTDLDPELPDAAADPVALRRILENLVRNGLEAVDGRGGGVTITTGTSRRGEGAAVRIVVADEGPGIPPDEQERIFDDFYSTREEGTGLGLSIVRRLVADLDGTLAVQSEPGAGAEFSVELPAASAGRGDGDGPAVPSADVRAGGAAADGGDSPGRAGAGGGER